MKTSTKIFIGLGIATAVTLTIVLILASRKFRLKNKNPKKILIVGDSQVAIQTEGGSPITYTYPNILRQELTDKTIDVVAIGGKRTEWMVSALKDKLATNKYDRVYIHGGGNDTSSPVSLETTLSNIQTMVNDINSNGADAFVVLGYKIEGESGRFGNVNILPKTIYVTTPEQWRPLVEKRKELQKRIPQVIQNSNFVPIYDLMQLTEDGIHPNAEGHKIVAKNILKTLE